MKRCLKCDEVFESEGWACPACGAEPGLRHGWPAFAPELADDNQGYDPERFAAIPDIDDHNFYRLARRRLFTWALGRYFPAARSYLEVGAGLGVVLSAVAQARPELELWGTEIYASGLEALAANVPRARLFQADARSLPFRSAFDVIGAFDVLEHIDDDAGVLAELGAVLKPGGGLLVSVPQHPSLWSARDEAVSHKRRYTRGELVRKLEQAGFSITRATSFMSLPIPAMWWSAVRHRELRDDYDPFAEFKIGRLPNAILNGVLAFERGLLQRGVSFPVGGTLLAVAQRTTSAGST